MMVPHMMKRLKMERESVTDREECRRKGDARRKIQPQAVEREVNLSFVKTALAGGRVVCLSPSFWRQDMECLKRPNPKISRYV